jgi:hypothetical protein
VVYFCGIFMTAITVVTGVGYCIIVMLSLCRTDTLYNKILFFLYFFCSVCQILITQWRTYAIHCGIPNTIHSGVPTLYTVAYQTLYTVVYLRYTLWHTKHYTQWCTYAIHCGIPNTIHSGIPTLYTLMYPHCTLWRTYAIHGSVPR